MRNRVCAFSQAHLTFKFVVQFGEKGEPSFGFASPKEGFVRDFVRSLAHVAPTSCPFLNSFVSEIALSECFVKLLENTILGMPNIRQVLQVSCPDALVRSP